METFVLKFIIAICYHKTLKVTFSICISLRPCTIFEHILYRAVTCPQVISLFWNLLFFFGNRLPYIWDPIIETNSYLLIDNDNQIWPSLIFLEAKKIYCLQEKFTTILTKSCVTGQIIPYCSFLSWLTPQKQILINISIVFLNSIALLCGIIAYAFEKATMTANSLLSCADSK